jgi:hypothetical protein
MDKEKLLEFLENQEESPAFPKGLPLSDKQKTMDGWSTFRTSSASSLSWWR